jgi:tetratricopeptide (TPR) repeat protein
MHRPRWMTPQRILAAFVLAAALVLAFHAVFAQEREEFKNLKVLPKDISTDELRRTMGQFTRALGVRCDYCHAAHKDQTPGLDFAADDKAEKRTARVMMQMTRELNEKYIATLEDHSDPPIRVQCATCHHGIAHPRPLAEVLELAYARGGVDSTRARYSALRDRYYGRAAYDFGEVPLADVGSALTDSGHVVDGNRIFAMNLEMNPKSAFAQRQLAASNLWLAFHEQGGDSGVAVYQRVKSQFGQPRDQQDMVAHLADRLMQHGKADAALAAYQLNTTEHPESPEAYHDLGDAYVKRGDRKSAIDSYLKAVSLDPSDSTAVRKLQDLKVSRKKIEKARTGKK